MKKFIFCLCPLIVLTACGDGSGLGNEISTNTDNSDNSIITTGEGSGRVCIRCESEAGLEGLGYDVEGFINCTNACGLPANGDPEKVQCDRDCIAERIEIAAEICRQDNGCE